MSARAASQIVPPEAYDIRRVGEAVIGFRLLPASKRQRWTLDSQRVGEIEAIIKHRHGAVVDTDDGAAYLEAAAPHLPDTARADWARRWLPLLSRGEVAAILASGPRRLKAVEAGNLLCMTAEERAVLGLCTIRVAGQSDEELAAARLERRAAAVRSRRAAQPKPETITSAKPWEAEGVSRRTWYRRQQAQRGTKNEATKSIHLSGYAICATACSQEGNEAAPRPPVEQAKDRAELKAPARVERVLAAAQAFSALHAQRMTAIITAVRKISCPTSADPDNRTKQTRRVA